MTRKIYRTAQGKMVDLGALQLQNENVRAVGNMGVNARGDLVDSSNRPISTRGNRVGRQYNRQSVPSPVPDSGLGAKSAPVAAPAVDIPAPPEDFQDDFVKETPADTAPMTTTTTGGGLAAAIAKARQIKQEPMKPRNKTQTGITKI